MIITFFQFSKGTQCSKGCGEILLPNYSLTGSGIDMFCSLGHYRGYETPPQKSVGSSTFGKGQRTIDV